MRIDLEKFQQADFGHYFALVSDERVMAQITERSIPIEEAQRNFEALLLRNKKYGEAGSYKIYDRFSREYIGLGHITPDEKVNGVAEIGYMILPQYWGKGYGTKVARALIAKAEEAGVECLKAIIDPANIPSRKILYKHGFASEKLCEMDGLPGEILSKVLERYQS